MFQRRKDTSLPTTSSLNVPAGGLGAPFGGGNKDGSGKGIKMEAPIVKAWKGSSGFTKYTYYFLIFFVCLLFAGYRSLRYWNASIWLTCTAQECTLQFTPAGSRTTTVDFSRTQLVSAQAVKVDKWGAYVGPDTTKYEPPPRGKGKKKNAGSYKGPDEDGNFRTYAIQFRKTSEAVDTGEEQEVPDGDFTPILNYLNEEEDGTYMLYMRQFGLAQSRTRVRSNVNKVESYVRKRRQKLVIKENASLPWQGILCLIFGLLGVMLTLLIGQLWDEPAKKHGGPGVRRQQPRRPGKDSKFVIDTGRPSKYPKGYYRGMKQ